LKEKFRYLQKVWQNGVFFKNTAKRQPNVGKKDGRGKTATKRRPRRLKSAAKSRQKRRPWKNGGKSAAKSAAKISGQTAALEERFALTTAVGYAGRHQRTGPPVIQNGSGKNSLVLFRRKTRVSSKEKNWALLYSGSITN
jgi:hypothetical protein